MEHILLNIEHNIATLTLNRPEVLNAMDETMIAQMHQAIQNVAADDKIRALVLQAEGKAFCAGGDLNWMRRAADYSESENIADAQNLGDMLYALHTLPKPTIAMVHGAVYGGGVGVVCACDIALGLEDATFCLSEVKIGLMPSLISPYVLQAMGPRQARRFYLTAEVINAQKAQKIGLLHEVFATNDAREHALEKALKHIKRNGPGAMAAAKEQIAHYAQKPITPEVVADSAARIAKRRATAEGKEGISAFLEKRKPTWVG